MNKIQKKENNGAKETIWGKQRTTIEIKIGCDRTQNFTLVKEGGVIPSRVLGCASCIIGVPYGF